MRIRMVAAIAGILLASSAWPQWNIQTVDNSGNTGKSTAIAYDAQGYPHVGYSDSHGQLYHAFWTGLGWQIENVEGGGDWSGDPVAIAIDGSGKVHMASGYDNGGGLRSIRYSRRDGGVWSTVHIKYMDGLTGAIGLTLAPGDVPHISYCYGGDLHHAYKPASTWLDSVVDGSSSVGRNSSMTSDASGHLYIAYSDDSDGDLKFAYYDGSVWSTQIVDMPGTVATYGVSLKLDGSGNPCIAYYDQTNGDLKYATFTGTLGGKGGRGAAGR